MILAIEALETCFCKRDRMSPALSSSFDLLKAP